MNVPTGTRGKAELIIIGAGPAGVSAALEAIRQGLNSVLLIERNELGGSLRIARKVENFPPWPVTTGSFLVELFKRRILETAVAIVKDEVIRLRPPHKKGEYFVLDLKSKRKFLGKSVVLATGQRFVLPEELSFLLPFARFPDQVQIAPPPRKTHVAILGGGEVALDQALLYREIGFEVTVLTRSIPRASRKLIEEFMTSSIRMTKGRVISASNAGLGRINLIWGSYDNRMMELEVDLLVVACGKKPDYPEICGYRSKELTGILGKMGVSCSIPGMFLAGDLKNGRERYVSLAVADGLRAAQLAARYLNGLKDEKGVKT